MKPCSEMQFMGLDFFGLFCLLVLLLLLLLMHFFYLLCEHNSGQECLFFHIWVCRLNKGSKEALFCVLWDNR